MTPLMMGPNYVLSAIKCGEKAIKSLTKMDTTVWNQR